MARSEPIQPMFPNERLRPSGDFVELGQKMASSNPEMFKKAYCANAVQTTTDCASAVGIAVSLIEGIIATTRVLFMMNLGAPEIQEALKDLKDTYELGALIAMETEQPQGRLLDLEWRNRDGNHG